MWYHAIAHYGTKRRYWWNRQKDDIVEDVLLPFVSKQVRPATRRGISSLFNFGTTQYITIVKTNNKLKKPAKGKTPSELSNETFVKNNCATDEFVDSIRLLKSSVAGRSLIQRALTEPENKIFVIMKFGEQDLDDAYTSIIKPLCEKYGYEVVRVDEIQDGGNITEQILEHISTSKLIFADLSGERPNCYYEAGFAHALGKEIIFSIRESDQIHFDLAGYRFLTWKTETQLKRKLKERLEAINEKGSG